MKKNISLLLVGFSVCANAQSLDQQVIAAGGGALHSENGVINYTIGEPLIQTVDYPNGMLTQGFHQNYFSALALDDQVIFDPQISIYPNPSHDLIYLNTAEQGLEFRILSLDGKRLQNGRVNPGLTQINLADYANGLYLVEIIATEKGVKKIYKITKQ